MKKHEERIELAISQELRDALVFEAKRAYGDIELEKAILNILEEWLADAEEAPVLDGELCDEPAADALALPEEQRKVLEFAAPALEAGTLDPDYWLDFLHWNGNSLENIQRARAQVMEILPIDSGGLRGILFSAILKAVEESKREHLWDPLTGWLK